MPVNTLCKPLDVLRNKRYSAWLFYLCYRSYRRVGYSPAEAQQEAERANPSYHWHVTPDSDESRFRVAIADALVAYHPTSNTYTAYASGYDHNDNGKPRRYRYVKIGSTARGAYADLCRAIRFDLRVNHPDMNSYWLAVKHGQPVYNG